MSLATGLRSFSMSAPFLPITTPGRAEWIVTRHFLCGRSITILRHRGLLELLHQLLADLHVLVQQLAVLALPANQRESQVRLMPSRRPIGLTF